MAHVLKEAGYATAVAGKWQLALQKQNLDHPAELGFEESCLFGWHEGPRYWKPLMWQNGRLRDDVAGWTLGPASRWRLDQGFPASQNLPFEGPADSTRRPVSHV